MSMIKQFPAQNFDEHTNSRSTTASSKFIGKHSETNLSQHFLEIHVCPAVSMEETTITNQDDDDDSDDDGAFDKDKPNPWAVTQSDGQVIFERTNHQRNSCFCPSHSMDSYNKVMVPFVKQLKRSKNSSETSLNPYTKTKIVHNYELLARRIQELQQIVTTMKTELGKQFQKYRKLYEQHIKNQNGMLIPILLQTEDKINALKSRVNEAVELYNEVAIIDVHFAEPDSSSSSELLTVIESSLRKGPKPKETTATRLIRVMRRVQQLQDKLKSGHYRHYGSGSGGGGDHAD